MVPIVEGPVRKERPAPAEPEAWRVEVLRRPDVGDPEGESLRASLVELGLRGVTSVRTARGYFLSPHYAEEAVREIAAGFLSDPVVNEVRLRPPLEKTPARDGAHRILVMPRPGVMDPVARTVEAMLVDTGRAPRQGTPGVSTFRVFELEGRLASDELALAASKVLANETIEVVRIDRGDLPYGAHFPVAKRGRIEVALLGLDDAGLARKSAEECLSLSVEEMRAVQAHFRGLSREPTACELETIAQTWSEHCKHKTLTGIVEFESQDGSIERIDNLLKQTIARATRELDRPFCLSVFVDNAGIVDFDQGQALAIKVETHNHPSAIDPYGGAGTGAGGVIRDVLGAGLAAKPIANTDAFFVGPPDWKREDVPRGTMHPRRILRGVVAGVRDYGNRMGIPTVSGGVWFHPGYVANPLVFCGTIGLLPREAARKEVRAGDAIVVVGGRTGRDGIHGATFSSIELSETSETASSSAVQIGDPITEKRVLDCLLRARDRGLYRSVTDCGAGGFSSAVGEMAEGHGAEVDLQHVPLKYSGLASHEVWISEAQERMVLAVPQDHVRELRALFQSEDVEATVIGRFTDTQRLVVRDQGELVLDLDLGFLHGGAPRPVRKARAPARSSEDPGCPAPADHARALLDLLRHPDIASKEWILRQYDHEVQGTSVVKPLVGVHGDGPGDAVVLQPLASSRMGAVISCGANPRYGLLDAGAMAEAAIDEALRNAVAVGADPDRAAILDNFSWGNCAKPEQLGSLVLAAKACYRAALAYRTPFVSGKDSLNNEYRVGAETLSIPPTLLVTCLATMPDVGRALTMDLKGAGNRLYLVGTTRAELGGSHYLELLGLQGGRVPRPDLERAPALLADLHRTLTRGLARAVHDLSEGGLAVALAEMAFAGDLGASLDLARVPVEDPADARVDPDAVRLFSQSCTRFLVEVEPAHERAFALALSAHAPAHVGEVRGEPTLRVRGVGGRELLALPIGDLRAAYRSGFQG
jgi:phosphoribosylformylglycinamidine synthase II